MNLRYGGFRCLGNVLLTLPGLAFSVWGALALGYRLAWPAWAVAALIAAWSLCTTACLVALWRRQPLVAVAGYLLCSALLLGWWSGLKPSNQRVWADDVAAMTSGRLVGSQLLLENVRNFDWRSDQDYRIAWESRRYDLRQLVSVDLITSYWGMPAIAHVLVSFGFEDGRFLTFSVEVRKEKGEQYSELGGFFKQFELSIVATDERDALRVRTNVRGEDAYLYRLDLPRPIMRSLLLAYVEQANQLRQRPRFYNTFTANCTTLVFDMVQEIVGGLPLDHRLLLTGYLPGYVMDIGGLQPGVGLDELRRLGRFTDRARAAGQAPDFSQRIRAGVPGWQVGRFGD